MRLFSKLPIDVVYNILEYTNVLKKRNGFIMFQIRKDDPRINMLLEKYRRINKLDYYMDNPKLVVRFLNENHYIRSSYATIKVDKRTNNNFPYLACIRIVVVKFDRFKNGNIKQKSIFNKYSHLIMDTH
jgi:hypothetical protein